MSVLDVLVAALAKLIAAAHPDKPAAETPAFELLRLRFAKKEPGEPRWADAVGGVKLAGWAQKRALARRAARKN